MKKALKIFGYCLLGLLVLVLGMAAYIQWSPAPTYHDVPIPEVKITPDSARIAEGARIALTICAYCHRGADGKLSGDLWINDPEAGKLWSANITQHPEAGIGKYTDGELVRVLRTGVKRDGHLSGPFMTFPSMSDEDIAAVISFLRSDAPQVQPSPNRQPPADLSLIFKMLTKLIFKPDAYPEKTIVAPPPTDQLAYGRYLATAKWYCFDCHSASFETNNKVEPEKSPGYCAGGNPVADKENNIVNSANITPDPETGIGSWTLDEFGQAVRFGKRPDGKNLRHQMPPMTLLTDEEVAAIWTYLQTVPPVKNAVERNFE